MPEVGNTPPMTRTQIRTDRIKATAEIVMRSADISSGENLPAWIATVAPAGKENAITGAERADLPRGRIRNDCR